MLQCLSDCRTHAAVRIVPPGLDNLSDEEQSPSAGRSGTFDPTINLPNIVLGPASLIKPAEEIRDTIVDSAAELRGR